MTKQTTRTFTGDQIASIVGAREILTNLNIKYLGVKDANKLNKLLTKCVNIFNDIIKTSNEFIQSQNQSLITNNPDYTDLLREYSAIRSDITKANKFINEHKELEFLVSKLESDNKESFTFQTELGNRVYEMPYTIDNSKLEIAIENINADFVPISKVSSILFLFD